MILVQSGRSLLFLSSGPLTDFVEVWLNDLTEICLSRLSHRSVNSHGYRE